MVMNLPNMQKVALYVDQKTSEIMRANHTLSTSMASVLTAINVVDEMFKISEEKETLRESWSLRKSPAGNKAGKGYAVTAATEGKRRKQASSP